MWLKFELYILSLFILFFLLFLNKVPVYVGPHSHFVGLHTLLTKHLLVTLCVLFMALGLLFYWRFNHKFAHGSSLPAVKVDQVENINYESVTFLATYIVPLACIDLDKDRSAMMLITILILIGWIYIKTNLFYTNPTLAIWGYQIYKISTATKKNIVIVVRGKVKINDDLLLKNIDDKIYLARKNKP